MNFEDAIKSSPASLQALSRLQREPCPLLPVLTAKVKLLWRCNLSCVFCSLPSSRAMLSRETARSLALDLAGLGLRKIHFSGGEVLLHPQCFDIFTDWSALGIQVNLTSNGLLLGGDEVRRLEDAGVHSVSLSIDSARRRIHDGLRGCEGSHRAVLRAAERITKRNRIRLRINTVVTSRNIRTMSATREFVRSLGPGVPWKLIPVDTQSLELLPSRSRVAALAADAVHWEELEDREPFGSSRADHRATAAGRHGFREIPCFAPWFHLFFSPEGDCYPCCMARGTTHPLGRFPDRSVRAILEDGPMCRFRQRMAAGERLDVCAGCDDFLSERYTIAKLRARAEVP